MEDFRAAGLPLAYELKHAGKKVTAIKWHMEWPEVSEAPQEPKTEPIEDAMELQAEAWIAAQSDSLQMAYKRLQVNNQLSRNDARQVVKHVWKDVKMVQRVHDVCNTIKDYVAKAKRDGKLGVRNMNAFTILCLRNEFPALIFYSLLSCTKRYY